MQRSEMAWFQVEYLQEHVFPSKKDLASTSSSFEMQNASVLPLPLLCIMRILLAQTTANFIQKLHLNFSQPFISGKLCNVINCQRIELESYSNALCTQQVF